VTRSKVDFLLNWRRKTSRQSLRTFLILLLENRTPGAHRKLIYQETVFNICRRHIVSRDITYD